MSEAAGRQVGEEEAEFQPDAGGRVSGFSVVVIIQDTESPLMFNLW